jgi:hypothetical protein
MSRLKARLERLEAELTPATPNVLIIRAVAGPELISEYHLVLHPTNRRGRPTGMWAGRPAEIEPRLDRR